MIWLVTRRSITITFHLFATIFEIFYRFAKLLPPINPGIFTFEKGWIFSTANHELNARFRDTTIIWVVQHVQLHFRFLLNFKIVNVMLPIRLVQKLECCSHLISVTLHTEPKLNFSSKIFSMTMKVYRFWVFDEMWKIANFWTKL